MKVVPLDYSNGLLYWRNCQDETLLKAVDQFVKQASLDSESFTLLKSYFHHWTVYPFYQFEKEADQEDLLATLLVAQSTDDLWEWLEKALGFGIDPL